VAVTARLEVRTWVRHVEVQRTILRCTCRLPSGGIRRYYKEQQKSFRDLVFVLVLAIVLVFCVSLLNSVPLRALAILASPAFHVRCLYCAADHPDHVQHSSFMGMIMVIGIVAKNGILLLDADQKFRDLGFSAEQAILQSAVEDSGPLS